MSEDTARIRDQLGNDPEVFPVLIPDYDEFIGIQEGATFIETNNIGESWIVGSSSNGIVGTNTNTASGNQQVVGGSGRFTTLKSIQNPNDTHIERFVFDDFLDSGNTTADWDSTTDYRLEMTSGEVAQSTKVYKGTNNVIRATMILDIDTGSINDLTLQLGTSNSDFETVTNNIKFSFTTPRAELYWKITASGTVNINSVKIIYEFV